jgi:hypothetical protein
MQIVTVEVVVDVDVDVVVVVVPVFVEFVEDVAMVENGVAVVEERETFETALLGKVVALVSADAVELIVVENSTVGK